MARMTGGWLRPGEVWEQFRIQDYVLRAWAHRGCPALDGARIRSEADDRHRNYHVYWRPDLERALAAITSPPVDEFDEGGFHWVSAKVAAPRYKVTRPLLYRWHHKGCPWLEHGAKLQVKTRRLASSNTKKVYERWFFNEDQLKDAARARSQRRAPTEAERKWLTATEVQLEWGRSKTFLHTWAHRRCPLLGGRRLTSQFQQREGRGRYGTIAKRRRVYLRADLETLARSRAAGANSSDDGHWLTAQHALDQFGFDEASLHYWRARSCIYLDDRKTLLARKEPSLTKDGRPKEVWKYYKPHLQLIAQRRAASASGVYRENGGTWLTQRSAVARYGVYSADLTRWRARPSARLGGRTLRARRVQTWSARNKHGLQWVYHEGDVGTLVGASCHSAEGAGAGTVSGFDSNVSEQAHEVTAHAPAVGADGHRNGPEPDPDAPYEPPAYFLKFDISSDTLRQTRCRGSLPGRLQGKNGRWLYSVPVARRLWRAKFEDWEQKRRAPGEKA